MALISQQQFDTNTFLPTTLSYYGFDGHGSVRFLMDTNGTITDTYTYDAFGNLIASNGDTPNDYLYAGQRFDSDIRLYNNRARVWNTDAGRFWSRDGDYGNNEDPLSLHKYLYTEDDPENNVDPSGHDIVDDILTVADSIASLGRYDILDTVGYSAAGPDVTATLNSTLQDVADTFNGEQDLNIKIDAAGDMRGISGDVNAGNDWDIYPLYELGFERYVPYYLDVAPNKHPEYLCGSGPGGGTVTFNNQVYYGGSVNYALWGKMNRLVHDWLQNDSKSEADEYNLDNALHTMRAWKHWQYGDFGTTEEEAEEFTRYGYDGVWPSNGLIGAYCRPSTVKVQEPKFNWYWLPLKSL